MPLARYVLLCVVLLAHYEFAGEAEWHTHVVFGIS